MLDRLDESDASKLEQIVVFHAAAEELSDNRLDQRQILLDKHPLGLPVAALRAQNKRHGLLMRVSRILRHGSLFRPMVFRMVTRVPLPGADSIATSSMNASITVKPMPDRSSSGRDV